MVDVGNPLCEFILTVVLGVMVLGPYFTSDLTFVIAPMGEFTWPSTNLCVRCKFQYFWVKAWAVKGLNDL